MTLYAMDERGRDVPVPEAADPMREPTEVERLERAEANAYAAYDVRRQLLSLARSQGDAKRITAARIEEEVAYLVWMDAGRDLDAAMAKAERNQH